jgi:hypothetical protein
MTDIHYEWELQDAQNEWQAGGSCNELADAQREGTRYLMEYSQNGAHKLIIREHRTQVVTMTPAPDFRALCAELLQECQNLDNNIFRNLELWNDARAALATPPPEPPEDDDRWPHL